MRQRIRSGESLKVYKSQWISRSQTFKPISSATLDADFTVAELFNDNQQWKEILIHQHFTREDTEKILQIQLLNNLQPYQILWHYDKKGQYWVKSGYQIAMKIKHSELSSCSKNTRGQWNVIWSTELLQNIKIFMWRATKNLLPTIEILWKRRIVQDLRCPRCKMKVEDVIHVVMECKPAKQICQLTLFFFFFAEVQLLINQDLPGMIQEMVKRRNKEELRLIIALCWAA